ncbi:putrescine export ABC transporter permease SapC [Arsenophonus symbiont of Ornithomya chloropus]|uniref:putrescine export ABC transporter permease SapC n=1 Tax=Arsenophonus symbiont of Ornithomya chloropus TaxID=634121 RepID=UPI0032B1BE86
MFSDNFYYEQKIASPIKIILHYFYNDIFAMTGFYGVLFLLFLSLFGTYLAPYSINEQFLGYQLLPPSWCHHGNITFFLGTDDLGRDIMSQLLIGTASTFGSSCIITISVMLFGLIFGCLAAITNGLKSVILHHILDTLLSIPSLLLSIIIITFSGASLKNAIIAIWLALLPRIVKTVHSTISNELDTEYVLAARLDGASNFYIIWYTILPNVIHILVIEITYTLSIAILDIVALGFLDLGARLPTAEWGAMVGNSLELIYIAPWTVFFPNAAIMISILFINLLGDGLHRAINAGME